MEEGERHRRLLAMVRAEFALPEVQLRDFTMSRIRMFLKLPMDTGKKMASAYDALMLQMPGVAAMRRVSLVADSGQGLLSRGRGQAARVEPQPLRWSALTRGSGAECQGPKARRSYSGRVKEARLVAFRRKVTPVLSRFRPVQGLPHVKSAPAWGPGRFYAHGRGG